MRTPEQNRAYVKKHQQEKLDDVIVRPPKGTKARWKAAAELKGVSLRHFIIDTVDAAAEALGITKESQD